MRTAEKTLSFPFGGVARKGAYRKQTRPYSSPGATNVRGYGLLESRERGGSRPGLVELDTVSTANEAVWQWPNGEAIQWPNGEDMTYALSSPELTLPSGTKVVRHDAEITAISGIGTAPTGYTVSCIYRDRLILVQGNLWWASRMGDHSDWSIADDMDDAARAVAGAVGLAGNGSEPIIAAIPFRDAALVFATRNSLWVLKGDPATGSMDELSGEVGITSPFGWALNDHEGLLIFLSNDGVYYGGPTSKPKRFSEDRLPDSLRNIDPESNTITMAYDPTGRGYHLFITPETGTGSHYWLEVDEDTRAIWPVSFADGGHQPIATGRIKHDGLQEVAVLGRDDTWRKFSESASDDDGEDLTSRVIIGPFRLASGDAKNAMLAEMHGMLADNSGDVIWSIAVGETAEEATDNAVANTVVATGTWSELRNRVVRPRVRGAWAAVILESTNQWAFEAIAITARQLGRIR
ncbi:hypothetical protein [Cerasicoccus frondis]|uniref:hypothetical protein n=1 Tax=Cerasicoccus frondis TaxID=490090 RepID=UPI002852863E|nr:hypothetical protein [Cerasicoccus frondis]